MIVSYANEIREESEKLRKALKSQNAPTIEDANVEELVVKEVFEDEQKEKDHFEFLCWTYEMKHTCYEDFKAFIEMEDIKRLKYSMSEYMILYISTYKARFQKDDISNKRITFLKFCISKDVFFTETLFKEYLKWDEENSTSSLSRWEKMRVFYMTYFQKIED
jgi:hypothetical protein